MTGLHMGGHGCTVFYMDTTQPRQHVSVDDLALAAQWLLSLEGESGSPIAAQEPEDDDEDQARLRRVSAWINAEIARREEDALVRAVARKHGRKPSDPVVRQSVQAHLAQAAS